jgi:hypothetical protein
LTVMWYRLAIGIFCLSPFKTYSALLISIGNAL